MCAPVDFHKLSSFAALLVSEVSTFLLTACKSHLGTSSFCCHLNHHCHMTDKVPAGN